MHEIIMTEKISIKQIIDELDRLLGHNDYAAAQAHLENWIRKSQARGDMSVKLSLLNEMMGLCRKVGKRDEAYDAAEGALALCAELNLSGSVTEGTTCVNAATVYKSFDDADIALPLYRRARSIYEQRLDRYDSRLGGLYNNMALALVDMRDFESAYELYRRALEVMSNNRYGQLEMAITYLNMANAKEADLGPIEADEYINECIDRARELLDTPDIPRNGYYAFVCEKCAPTFGYYGYFLDEREYSRRAQNIYSGGCNEGN